LRGLRAEFGEHVVHVVCAVLVVDVGGLDRVVSFLGLLFRELGVLV
jgi:hypothetical protein